MTDRDSFPDEVPVPDAVEQLRPAADPLNLETVDPHERVPVEDGAAPLESNESDWHEQRQIVEGLDEDELR